MARKKKNAGAAPLTSPQTRGEHYLANIAGLVGTKPEYPFTRTERYLDAISGSTSGLDDRVTALEIGKLDVVGKGVNLLDNAYFIGGGTGYGVFPVNQRGDTNGYVGMKYGIDRWWMSAAGGTVTPLADGLELKYTGTNCGLYQFFMDGVIIPGNQYTGSLLFSDGTILTGTAVASEDGSYTEFSRNTKIALGIRKFTKDSVQRWCFVFANITTGTIKVIAAKLELGTQQTLARQVNGAWVLNDAPPDYGEELAKCQRYLQIIKGGQNAFVLGSGFMNTKTEARFTVPLTVPMAAINQIVEDGSIVFNVGGTWVTTGISSVHIINQQDSELYMSATLSSDMTQFAIVVACLDFSKTLLFSAE